MQSKQAMRLKLILGIGFLGSVSWISQRNGRHVIGSRLGIGAEITRGFGGRKRLSVWEGYITWVFII